MENRSRETESIGSDQALPPEVRRTRIAELVESQDFVRVAELSRRFGTSEVTIRNDLDLLERMERVRRVHGGAVSVESGPKPENPFEISLAERADFKRAIGQAAAARVVDGETILIDVGTTTTAMAAALARRRELTGVTAFTNSLNVALELESAIPRLSVVVIGGTLRSLQHSLVDPLGGVMLDRLRVDTVFLGCTGVDASGGVTNVNLPEADMKRRMIASADRSVVLADSSKLGVVSTDQLCHLDEIDLLITDGEADPGIYAELQEAGLAIATATVGGPGRGGMDPL